MKLIGLRMVLAFERWYLNRLRFQYTKVRNSYIQKTVKTQVARVKSLEKRVDENSKSPRKSK